MKLVNLTPHSINIVGEDGAAILTLAPSGQIARRATGEARVATICGVPVFQQELGDNENLPAPEAGTYLVVSGLVRTTNPSRGDLLSPGRLLRDEAGQPVGCVGLVANAPLAS